MGGGPEFSSEKRSAVDRRGATDQQTAPTGDGMRVLDAVVEYINNQIKNGSGDDITHMLYSEGLAKLREDLKARAEMGKAKYGTYLRINNGRKAEVDGYQELCDAIMYGMQAKLERNKGMMACYVPLLVRLASMLSQEV